MSQKLAHRAVLAGLFCALTGLSLGDRGAAYAADFGGDCCADLEERVAELEATTVRKGNKKVSVTLSGWVVKSINWWDDGDMEKVQIGDKDLALSSNFLISGEAVIAPGWKAGYATRIEAPGGVFGFVTDQNAASNGVLTGFSSLNTFNSYMWLRSDRWGTINWGTSSHATDNLALLVDPSGTVIESNAIFMEGAGFLLRPKGGKGGMAGLEQANWSSFLTCSNLNAGADCNGLPTPNVHYDSPTFGGLSFSTSYGLDDFWDFALKYNNNHGPFRVSAAAGYMNMRDPGFIFGGGPFPYELDADFWQFAGSLMHNPTGLWVYAMYEFEKTDKPGLITPGFGGSPFTNRSIPDSDLWFMKAGIKRNWNALGATVLWGEAGQYFDMFGGLQLQDVCVNNGGSLGGVEGTNLNAACATNAVTVTESKVNRWGLGVVQEIDSAAMHLFARWQHQEIDASFQTQAGSNVRQDFEDWDLFQLGGILFF